METLKKFGWHLTEDSVYNYLGDDFPTNETELQKILLDCDIREIVNFDEAAAASATTATTATKQYESGDLVDVPFVLQIQKVRNVAVPKAQEHKASTTSRLLRLSLTDGKLSYNALEMGGNIKGLDANIPPGTKLQLSSAARNERGFLLLTPSNCRILGGRVEKLIEKWRLKDTHSSLTTRPRPSDGQSGPPPWVPFGQRLQLSDNVLLAATKNLRVMDLAATGQQEAPPVSEEFNQARQQVIAQAMQQDHKGGKKNRQGGHN